MILARKYRPKAEVLGLLKAFGEHGIGGLDTGGSCTLFSTSRAGLARDLRSQHRKQRIGGRRVPEERGESPLAPQELESLGA